MTSPVYLGSSRTRLPGFANLNLADIHWGATSKLPHADNSVDGIYCENLAETLRQPALIALLREFRRILKPGTRVRVVTPDLDEMLRQYVDGDWRRPWLAADDRDVVQSRTEFLNTCLRDVQRNSVFNEEELARLATLAGFEDPERCMFRRSKDPRLCGVETSRKRWAIVDDFFPNLLTGFRVAEYNAQMEAFPYLDVYSTLPDFDAHHEAYARKYPQFAARVRPYSANALAGCSLAYLNFLNNAACFLADLERNAVPFVLTLYPGGGFYLDEPGSDQKLLRVLGSSLLKGVIVTQPITEKYLKRLASGRGLRMPPIHRIIGGVVNPLYFSDQAARPPRPEANSPLNVCFVAQRYTAHGEDKGYPDFISAAHLLCEDENIQFHVVGGFSPEVVDVTKLGNRIRFYGTLETEELRRFFGCMDVVVSPNRPGLLHAGAFDGFPTGCSLEASLCGVAIMATDCLGLNPGYQDGKSIFLLDHKNRRSLAEQIAERLSKLSREPQRLVEVAEAGEKFSRQFFASDRQIGARRNVINEVAATLSASLGPLEGDEKSWPDGEPLFVMEFIKHAEDVPDNPLVSIVIPAFRADFFAACLQSAIGQTYGNLEILVFDDSPGDGIERIARENAKKDPRISYHRNRPPLGEPDNLTQAIHRSQGYFVKPLYDDDVLYPDAVEMLLDAFKAAPGTRLATGRRHPVDIAGKRLPDEILGAALAPASCCMAGAEVIGKILTTGANSVGEPTCMMFRRRDALAIPEANVMSLFGRLCFGAGDVALAMHLLSRGDLSYLAEPIAQFRIHPGQSQRQAGFRGPALQTWDYLRRQAFNLGFPLDPPSKRHSLLSDESPETWDEESYLAANRDVAAAVSQGRFESGRHHYQLYGKNEDRPCRPAASQSSGEPPEPAPADPEQRYRQAERLLAAGDEKQAADILMALVGEGTSLWMPYNDLGILAFQHGDTETAKKLLRAGADRDTGIVVRINLAKIAAAAGSYQEAREVLQPLLDNETPNADALVLMAEIEAMAKGKG
jgi:glycosyltransferase involved in cell wall biosynthesis/tetratricopeptide (TPR) repeat protein